MHLNGDVLPAPLARITASVSPSRISKSTPASAVIPPNRSLRSLTRRSASTAIPSSLVLRREDLVAGDLLHAGIGGLPGPHHPHRVVSVGAIPTAADAPRQPVVGVILCCLHPLEDSFG